MDKLKELEKRIESLEKYREDDKKFYVQLRRKCEAFRQAARLADVFKDITKFQQGQKKKV